MNFYVTMTTKCNLQCAYCYGKSCQDFGSDFGGLAIDYSLPTSISYEISDLTSFLQQDPKPTVIFYGGEPLLEIENIKKIMNNTDADRYIIQTNGLLLNSLDPEYIRRLNTILVSVDGDETHTDVNRGVGVHQRVISNLTLLRKKGFEGELIARMTVPVNTQIDQQVIWLLTNKDFPFKSIHWQLDALFWQNDPDRVQFGRWSKETYNEGMNRLVLVWIGHMENFGEVLKLYPFISIMQSLLLNEESKLRCGAGWNTFNIQTDGKITPCPVMAGIEDFYLGNIWHTDPTDLADSVFVSRPCTECHLFRTCGGRCLYANATKLWGEDGFKNVCDTVMNLVNSLKEFEPQVRHLLSQGKISMKDFEYGRFNSCEIIP